MNPTAETSKPVVWRLKKGFDRRFQSGHPWVFSNELAASPKGILPGAAVTLQDAAGGFLAHGFGNPSSLIAFREVSRRAEDANWDSEEFLERRLRKAHSLRVKLGLAQSSFRWVHGESDGLSGLVVDRYLLAPKKEGAPPRESVIVLQCHSSGMDRVTEKLIKALLKIDPLAKRVVVRNDVSTRKLEGLSEGISFPTGELSRAEYGELQTVLVRGHGGRSVPFSVDLRAGQKTGFFIDQTDNIRNVIALLFRDPEWKGKDSKKPLRVLDLCTYVGQWSTQIAAAVRAEGGAAEFTLVDVSSKALAIAKENVSRFAAKVETREIDVLKALDQVKGEFDLLICDPPALIQNRKHHPQGLHAYQKLNREAMKLLAPGALYVSCSCSQLLSQEDFEASLAKAEKMSKRKIAWVLNGSQALDHPLRADFPEGHYLKMQAGYATAE